MTEDEEQIVPIYDYEHKPTLFYRYSNGTRGKTGYLVAKENMKRRIKDKKGFTNIDAQTILFTMFSEVSDMIMEDFRNEHKQI